MTNKIESSDVVTLSVDTETMQALNSAVEACSDTASAALTVSDDDGVDRA